ncbi:rifampin ADP-ribosyl transferase [Exiguobacterium sp. RIT452]|uniref:Segregation and condensation protein A n=1 Tax=Exiguobacterium undae TaxID=169177 RepID=A0ABX2VCK4_9BACL|nr:MULTISPECIES: segregation/condensation protein A [Exiguobacterium]OAN15947.1 rifampin ADP-ribosyl transferase [Exiguobacterium undae]RJP02090.1 rifampin ADP-ribosyl transferase [Exiguobacterium sp. RIT452]
MESYSVKMDAFEGPLDLLLHLIGKLEIDLYDISVSVVTDQYVSYIRAMQHLELDVASEYLVMAATLLQLKSKQLLPVEQTEFEDVPDFEEEPTREGLIQQLIEYKAYKEAALVLKEKEEARLELFSKQPEDLMAYLDAETQDYSGNLSFSDLLRAYEKMRQRVAWKVRRSKTVKREERTLEQQMVHVSEYVLGNDGTTFFGFFTEQPTVEELVVSFLAVLELVKQRIVACEQMNDDILLRALVKEENQIGV